MEVKPTIRYLKYRGKSVPLILQADGSYTDPEGTTYPAMLFDPGFCGIEPFETGKGDPLYKICRDIHDPAFNRKRAGYLRPGETGLSVAGNFTGAILTEMLKSAYILLAGIPYIVVGGLGGLLRWHSIGPK